MNNNNKDFFKFFLRFLVGVTVITTIFISLIGPYFSVATEDPIKYVQKEYDFQLHASQYENFYNANKDSILKIGQPYSSEGNNFIKIVLDTKDKETISYGDEQGTVFENKGNKELRTVVVFKNINEQWSQFNITIPTEKTGLGFFNEDYKSNEAKKMIATAGSLLYAAFLGFFIYFMFRSFT